MKPARAQGYAIQTARWSNPCEEPSHRANASHLHGAISASRRCSVNAVWRCMAKWRAIGAFNAQWCPDWPHQCPSAAQIWRVKLATDVLPLVPVTAAMTAGCAPNHKAAAPRTRPPEGSSHAKRTAKNVPRSVGREPTQACNFGACAGLSGWHAPHAQKRRSRYKVARMHAGCRAEPQTAFLLQRATVP